MSSSPDRPDAPQHRAQRALLRAGDHDAFGRLFADHADEVFSLALRLTGLRAVAEDVTSEVYLVAWRRRHTVELSDLPLRSWLLAIAARQAMNATRGIRRRRSFLHSGRARPGVVADFADETAGRLDDARLLERTRAAMAALTRPELEVVTLCVWSELTYAEAAEALGVPVGTVRSRLNRARRRLRTLTAGPDPAPTPPSTRPAPAPTNPRGHR
ncbi:RNA polymerase sigma factor [Nocardioides sp. 503]|uniref:RNA polymerase sigma factor n=1 Tax=Nocardioides sp. 503 TaxID=2508326 RepID=UPI001431AE3D|nr:RNA polymerase sigma factor [Nocardioides sp. 503]